MQLLSEEFRYIEATTCSLFAMRFVESLNSKAFQVSINNYFLFTGKTQDIATLLYHCCKSAFQNTPTGRRVFLGSLCK